MRNSYAKIEYIFQSFGITLGILQLLVWIQINFHLCWLFTWGGIGLIKQNKQMFQHTQNTFLPTSLSHPPYISLDRLEQTHLSFIIEQTHLHNKEIVTRHKDWPVQCYLIKKLYAGKTSCVCKAPEVCLLKDLSKNKLNTRFGPLKTSLWYFHESKFPG